MSNQILLFSSRSRSYFQTPAGSSRLHSLLDEGILSRCQTPPPLLCNTTRFSPGIQHVPTLPSWRSSASTPPGTPRTASPGRPGGCRRSRWSTGSPGAGCRCSRPLRWRRRRRREARRKRRRSRGRVRDRERTRRAWRSSRT